MSAVREVIKSVVTSVKYGCSSDTLSVAFEEHSVRAYTIGLVEWLAKIGIRVDVFTTRWDINPELAGKRYIPMGFIRPNIGIWRYVRDLYFYALLNLGNYDVLHVNDPASWLLAWKASEKGVPILFTVHYVPQSEPAPAKAVDPLAPIFRFKKRVLPFIAEIADAVVVPSHYAERALMASFGIKAHVIYHGVDVEKFRPIGPDCQLKLRLGGKRIVLWVSRFGFHPYKDPFTFIRATPLVAKELEDVVFVMIGTGPLLRLALREINKVMKSGVRISVFKFVRDLVRWYNSADVFVFTSFDDAFGLVAAEAMACGTPVIVSDSGAPAEVVGDAGLVFKYGNPEDLADKILRVLTDEDLAYCMAIKGRRRVLKMFRWDIAARKYAKLYIKLSG